MTAYTNRAVYIAAIGALIGALGLMLWIGVHLSPPPPLAYTQDVYQPERAALCPGESLVYTNTLTVNRPALIPFTYSYWSIERQRFATPAEPLQYRPFAQGATLTARRQNVLPFLVAGRYELWFVAGENGRAAAWHRVPFVIRADC